MKFEIIKNLEQELTILKTLNVLIEDEYAALKDPSNGQLLLDIASRKEQALSILSSTYENRLILQERCNISNNMNALIALARSLLDDKLAQSLISDYLTTLDANRRNNLRNGIIINSIRKGLNEVKSLLAGGNSTNSQYLRSGQLTTEKTPIYHKIV